MGTNFELIIIQGDKTGEKYNLSEQTLTIGRKLPSDKRESFILIEDKTSTISSSQADIEWDNYENTHIIKSRKTTNPTKVNHKAIENSQILHPGDEIEMGKVILLYQKNFTSHENEDIPAYMEKIDHYEEEPVPQKVITCEYQSPPKRNIQKTSSGFLPDESHKYLFDEDDEAIFLQDREKEIDKTEIKEETVHEQYDEEETNSPTGSKTLFNTIKKGNEYELEIIKGDNKGHTFSLDKKEILIGRLSKKPTTFRDISFPAQDRTISREHAKIIIKDDGIYLVNESKKSITLINGIQVSEAEKLNSGDQIQIGENIVLLFKKTGDIFMEVGEEDSTVIPGIANEFSLPPIEGMVLVEECPFWMGNNEDSYSSPLHEVHTGPYYIDIYPVTNGKYRTFVEATKYKSQGNWESEFTASKENHPVVNITYNDAMEYTAWAGKRLPTEAEWEKAARGKDKNIYTWGNNWDKKRTNSKESNNGGTGDVGDYTDGKSPYGAMNMIGNTWEWTGSFYESYPYKNTTVSSNSGKVIRGGSWLNNLKLAGCTVRLEACSDEYGPDIGFRCARDI